MSSYLLGEEQQTVERRRNLQVVIRISKLGRRGYILRTEEMKHIDKRSKRRVPGIDRRRGSGSEVGLPEDSFSEAQRLYSYPVIHQTSRLVHNIQRIDGAGHSIHEQVEEPT